MDIPVLLGVGLGMFTIILFFRDIRTPKITRKSNTDAERENDLMSLVEKAHSEIMIVSGSGYAPIYNRLEDNFIKAFNRGVRINIVICGNEISTKDGKNALIELRNKNMLRLYKSTLSHRHFWVVDDSDVEIEETHSANSQKRFVCKIVGSISANRRCRDKFNQILSTSCLVSDPNKEFTSVKVNG